MSKIIAFGKTTIKVWRTYVFPNENFIICHNSRSSSFLSLFLLFKMSRLNFNFTRRVSDVTKKYYRAILQETNIFNIKFEIKHIKKIKLLLVHLALYLYEGCYRWLFFYSNCRQFLKREFFNTLFDKICKRKYIKIHLGKILMKIEHKNYRLRQSCNIQW